MTYSHDPLEDIQKELETGNFLIFAGAGLSELAGFIGSVELATRLQAKYGLNDLRITDSPLDATLDALLRGCKTEKEREEKRKEICEEIKNQLAQKSSVSDLSNPYYLIRKIVEKILGDRPTVNLHFFTTNWDSELKHTFGAEAFPIWKQEHYRNRKELSDSRVKIVKLRGDIEEPNPKLMVLTQEEAAHISNRELMLTHFGGELLGKRMLVLGYGLNDPDILDEYLEIRKKALPKSQDTDYVVDFNPSDSMRQKVKGYAQIIPMDILQFLRELAPKFGLILDGGVELEIDQKIAKIINADRRSIICTGPISGGFSTTSVRLIQRKLKPICVEARSQDAASESTKVSTFISEASKGQSQLILSPERQLRYYEIRHVARDGKENDIDELIRTGKIAKVKHILSEKDAKEVLTYHARKRGLAIVFSDEKTIKDVLDYAKRQFKDPFDLAFPEYETYCPSLLASSVGKAVILREEDPKLSDEQVRALIKEQHETSKRSLEVLAAIFGLGGSDFALSKEFKDVLAGIGSLILTTMPGGNAVFALLGGMAGGGLTGPAFYNDVRKWWQSRKRGGKEKLALRTILEPVEIWKRLGDEERRILCYQLDQEARENEPHDSYQTLSAIFSTREIIERIQTTLNEHQNELFSLQNRFDSFEKKFGDKFAKCEKRSEKGLKRIFARLSRLEVVVLPRLTGIEELSRDNATTGVKSYYGVDSNQEIEAIERRIWASGVAKEIKYQDLVEQLASWWNGDRDYSIYIVKGESGIGKSWFSCLLVEDASKFGHQRHRIYKVVKGTDIYATGVRGFFVADDQKLESNEIVALLQELAKRNDHEATGPVLICINSAEWNKVLSQTIETLTADHQENLHRRILALNLSRVSDKGIAQVLESLLAKYQGDGWSPKFIPSSVREELVGRANGIPIVLKLFLHSTRDARKHEIKPPDLDEIEDEPLAYFTKEIIRFYFSGGALYPESNDKDYRIVVDVFGLLKFIFAGERPVGLFWPPVFAGLEEDPAQAIRSINSQVGNNAIDPPHFPLFEVTRVGLLEPIHGTLLKAAVGELMNGGHFPLTEIRDTNIRRFTSTLWSLNFNYRLTRAVEQSYSALENLLSYSAVENELVPKVILYYGKPELFGNLVGEDQKTSFLFNYLSLLLPDLGDRSGRRIWDEGGKAGISCGLLQALSKIEDPKGLLQDQEHDLYRYLANHLKSTGFTVTQMRACKGFFLKCLKAGEWNNRFGSWDELGPLVASGILKVAEVKACINYFLDLGSVIPPPDVDLFDRWLSFGGLMQLFDERLCTAEDVRHNKKVMSSIFSRLEVEDSSTRLRYWGNDLPVFIKLRAVTINEARNYIDRFLCTLRSEDSFIRMAAWSYLGELSELKLLKPNEVTASDKECFFSLLHSQDLAVRFRVWIENRSIRHFGWDGRGVYLVLKLIASGVFTQGEIQPYKAFLIELLLVLLRNRRKSRRFFRPSEGDPSEVILVGDAVNHFVAAGVLLKSDAKPFAKAITETEEYQRFESGWFEDRQWKYEYSITDEPNY